MMTRKIAMMALLLIGGVVLGAAATEGYNVYRQSQDSYRRSRDSQIFQERLHCKAVADAYAKENSTDPNARSGFNVTVDKVDYSPARNSCVAELETDLYSPQGIIESESVKDLLSGETLVSMNSKDETFAAFQDLFLPRVWDYVMNNASDPVELEKQWALGVPKKPQSAQDELKKAKALQALIESQNLPKSTSPPRRPLPDPAPAGPTLFDPFTGERVQVPASQHK